MEKARVVLTVKEKTQGRVKEPMVSLSLSLIVFLEDSASWLQFSLLLYQSKFAQHIVATVNAS